MVHAFKSAIAGVIALGGATVGAADAAIMTCDGATAGKVLANDGCQYSTTLGNDFLNPTLAVNDEGFFGGGWTFDFKELTNFGDPADEGPNTLDVSFTGDGSGGTWTFNTPIPSGLEVMFIFKDGQSALPGTVVGYLISTISGTFMTPFINPAMTRETKDISHISVYIRGDVPEIPVPGAIWIMGAGLAGLGFFAARKKKRST